MNARDRARILLEHQQLLGPLPVDRHELKSFVDRLQKLTPMARIELQLDPPEAERLIALATAAGIRAERSKPGASIHFPADGYLLSHCFQLLGAPELATVNWAAKFLDALDRPAAGALPDPEWILIHQLAGPTAARLGYDPELKLLPVLVANGRIDRSRSRLEKYRRRAMIALSADHLRFFTSLDPPAMVAYDFEEARRRGVPEVSTTRLGFVEKSIPVARAEGGAAWIDDASGALHKAKACLEELDRAWGGGIDAITTIGWPIYLPKNGEGTVLDAVAGAPLPQLY